MLQFEVECETLWGEKVAVCGSTPSLGEWDVSRCVFLEPTNYPVWNGAVKVSAGTLDFKFLLVRKRSQRLEVVRWEFDGTNRSLECTAGEKLVLQAAFENRDTLVRTVEAYREARGDGGQLAKLNVPPALRTARVVRSRSSTKFSDKYEVVQGSALGTGMSGTVRVAKLKATGTEVALKTLSTVGLSKQEHAQVLLEVGNQLNLSHPNICRLLEVWDEGEQLQLVMERLRGPDLYDHWSRKGSYSERDAATIVRQMCSAIAYCHSHGVCHRDVKLENFCFEDDSEDAMIKLLDFGLSSLTSTPMTDSVGTLYYVAPEVLRGFYDNKCDMWSLGVVTYILLVGNPPFEGRDDRQTFAKIHRGLYSFPDAAFSPEATSFVRSLLVTNPLLRLDARGALRHDWLALQINEEAARPLDASVLSGIRAFTRSNVLKRAVMRIVAPVATVDDVSRWADQFKAVDQQGTGTLSVHALAEHLRTNLSVSEEEAKSLSTALAAVSGAETVVQPGTPGGVEVAVGEEVSYSSFLAACLSAQSSLSIEGQQLREIFSRLDKNGAGKLTVEDLEGSLGDLINIDELKEDLAGPDGDIKDLQISFDYFRWLLLQPSRGLMKVIGAYKGIRRGGGVWNPDSRVARQLKDCTEGRALEAARRENASWRMWRYHEQELTSPIKRQESPVSHFTHMEDAANILQDMGSDIQQDWGIATVEAKEGAFDAQRRENLYWRKWHMAQRATDGAAQGG